MSTRPPTRRVSGNDSTVHTAHRATVDASTVEVILDHAKGAAALAAATTAALDGADRTKREDLALILAGKAQIDAMDVVEALEKAVDEAVDGAHARVATPTTTAPTGRLQHVKALVVQPLRDALARVTTIAVVADSIVEGLVDADLDDLDRRMKALAAEVADGVHAVRELLERAGVGAAAPPPSGRLHVLVDVLDGSPGEVAADLVAGEAARRTAENLDVDLADALLRLVRAASVSLGSEGAPSVYGMTGARGALGRLEELLVEWNGEQTTQAAFARVHAVEASAEAREELEAAPAGLTPSTVRGSNLFVLARQVSAVATAAYNADGDQDVRYALVKTTHEKALDMMAAVDALVNAAPAGQP